MHLENSYKYEKDGIVYVSGNVPEGATIIEILDILVADDGYVLVKNGEIIGNSVWLHDGDTQDNYTEIREEE